MSAGRQRSLETGTRHSLRVYKCAVATGMREPPTDIPWMRRLLGDRQYAEFVVQDNAPDESVAMLRLAFPEATVCRWTESEFNKRTLKPVPLRQPPRN